MDYGLGVNMKSRSGSYNKKRSTVGNDQVKVVYISSPMKVKTTAAEFRALVQELTGKDSDTARLMEVKGNEDLMLMMMTDDDANNNMENTTAAAAIESSSYDGHCSQSLFNINQQQESSTCSDYSASTSLETFDEQEDLFLPMEGSFMSLFQPNYLTEFTQLDGFN
ncbi:Sigma factor binding protein 1, chloroplastic [Linum perenne]